MTLRDGVRILREHWVLVLMCVLLASGTAVSIGLLRTPEYTARILLFVTSQSGDNNSSAYQGSQLSEQRVKSYTSLISSPRVAKDVIAKLGLTTTPDELANRIVASSAPNSVLIDVAVQDSLPERAAAIANAVGDSFSLVVDQLEAPTIPNGVQAVAVRTVEAASVPTAPSSVGLPTILVLAVLGGLGVGIVGAFARSSLDTSIKSSQMLGDVASAPVLGSVSYDRSISAQPLAVLSGGQTAVAEDFRQLRTNLQFIDVDSARRVFVVTSSVPGEGKTTTVINLALALAAAGSRVVVVEGDLRRPRIADILGVERSVGLTSVLTGRAPLSVAVQQWLAGGIDVLASGALPPNPSELLGSENMRKLVDELRRRYDVVLIDTPPLLPVTDAAALAPSTDGVIVVCQYGKTRRTQVESLVQSIASVAVPVSGAILTMSPRVSVRASSRYNSYYGSGEESPDVSLATSSLDATRDSNIEATLQQPARRRPLGPQVSGGAEVRDVSPRPRPPGRV